MNFSHIHCKLTVVTRQREGDIEGIPILEILSQFLLYFIATYVLIEDDRLLEEGKGKTKSNRNKEKKKGKTVLFIAFFFLISFTKADLCKSVEIPIGIYLSALET